MSSSKSQTTMRKFLFEGFQNNDTSDELAFDFVGHVGSDREKSAAADFVGPALLISTATCAPDASSTSDCMLLNAISTPVTPSPLPEPDIQVLDPSFASPSHELARKRKKSYELNRHFQDSWAAKLPWAKAVMGTDGRISQVQCKVCSFVERREKLLVPKIDSLWKHAGRRKALCDSAKVKKGKYYYLGHNQHIKNEGIYYARAGESILDKIAAGLTQERKKKMVQFRTMFHLLTLGRPMCNYTACQDLYNALNVLHQPRKHWSEPAGWEIAHVLVHVVCDKIKEALAKANYIAISCDEVTTVDNQQWLCIHAYTCSPTKTRDSHLLFLGRVTEGGNANNLKKIILCALRYHGGLDDAQIAEKVISFGTDGASIFQGRTNGVTK
jgi:hypothetical protein